MKLVSNTGPIIGLAKIGRLDLLKSLAGEVLIPPFVHKELFGKLGVEAVRIEEGLRHSGIPILIALRFSSKLGDEKVLRSSASTSCRFMGID